MSSQTISQWEDDYNRKAYSASHDFRSDTVTLPSGSMLTSILTNASSFGDDVFSEDGPTNSLESYIGQLTGMNHAVFVSSGTMGNQLALRCLLQQPPYSVICHRHSHIFSYECGMTSIFSQAQLIPVMPTNTKKRAYLTLEDIIPNIVPDDGDTHSTPTRVIALENTFAGKITPVDEVKKIAEYAKAHGIKVHLDGARLWNACYANSNYQSASEAAKTATSLLREYCASVDSVSLCFSKSLGAPSGSILLGKTPEFISKARHFRKALGGGMRQVGVLTAAARVAVDEVFLSGEHLPRANAIAKELEENWKSMGGEVEEGVEQETNMVWLNLGNAGLSSEEFLGLATEEGVKVIEGRIVTHYQITLEGVSALKRVFKRAIDLGKSKSNNPSSSLAQKSLSHSYGTGRKSEE